MSMKFQVHIKYQRCLDFMSFKFKRIESYLIVLINERYTKYVGNKKKVKNLNIFV